MLDTSEQHNYNYDQVLQIVNAANAAKAFLTELAKLGDCVPLNLDNRTGSTLSFSDSENGGNESMARLKAKIDGRWITADSAQQLVNAALSQQQGRKGLLASDYIKQYMQLYKSGDAIAENTLVGYLSYLRNHLLPAFGDKDISEITRDVVQAYINDKSEKLAAKTIKEHITLMAEIFDLAVEDQYIASNPFRSKKLRMKGRKSEKVLAYTEDSYKGFVNLISALDGSDKLYAAITLYTGARRGEICALRWEDIDLEGRRIRINKSVSWPSQNQGIIKPPKTENGNRNIVILPQLYTILQEYRQDHGYLIRGTRCADDIPITRQGMKRLTERIDKAAKDCGLSEGFSNRRGRHTISTFMNNAEVDDKTIEGQIGHYDKRFTQSRYMNAQDKQMERGMDKLAAYIGQI